MAQSNVGKWKTFSNNQILYGPSGSGQNLNDDLERAIGDEQDAVLAETEGSGVVSGALVTASNGTTTASVAAGVAYVNGQRLVWVSALGVTGLNAASTTYNI